MTNSRVLVVEDEDTLRQMLQYNLENEGYIVLTASNGMTALELARQEIPDLILLDIMLPELDGFEVCRLLRQDMTVPVLMLTAKEEEIDKVLGLELGADDYMTKPFSMRELKARVKAMLRRADMIQPVTHSAAEPIITSNDLTIDIGKRSVTLNSQVLNLKPKEFELLAFMANNKGRVFSREALLERIWDYDYAGRTRTVDVHIHWLREKIETVPSRPKRLVTVRGIGYKFEE
jgi:DNA-binding response OmpR family regulator